MMCLTLEFWRLFLFSLVNLIKQISKGNVEYALSELGETLRPILDSMAAWGTAYKANSTDT